MHSKGFLHRDVKPDNFLMGIGRKQHLVYIIDFGLSKQYRDPKTGDHIAYRDGKSLTGTIRYASINTQLGIEQSRRDDLESLGFVYMYLLRGSLPWQGVKAATKAEKYETIKELKTSTSAETLCKNHPEEFCTYLNYCHKLSFDEKPDYLYLRKLFKDLYMKKGFAYDYIYDWNLKKPPSISASSTNVNVKALVGPSPEHKAEDKKESKIESKKEFKKEEKKTVEEIKKTEKINPPNKRIVNKKHLSSSRLTSNKPFDFMYFGVLVIVRRRNQ